MDLDLSDVPEEICRIQQPKKNQQFRTCKLQNILTMLRSLMPIGRMFE